MSSEVSDIEDGPVAQSDCDCATAEVKTVATRTSGASECGFYAYAKRGPYEVRVKGRKVVVGDRNFYEVSRENPNVCNLTELNAADQVLWKGYETHPDYISHISRYGHVFKYLMHHRTTVKTHLDVGCGVLQLPFYIWRQKTVMAPKYAYWGIDLRAQESWLDSVATVDFRWKCPVNLIRADITRDELVVNGIDGFPKQFDLVTCFEMFEHVPRAYQQSLLNALFRWTKPGGMCLFSSPNSDQAVTTAHNHVGGKGASDEGQSRERTYKEKLTMAEAAGFEVEDTLGTFMGTSRAPEWFRQRVEEDQVLYKIRKLLTYGRWCTVAAAAFPEQSNNVLYRLRRPKGARLVVRKDEEVDEVVTHGPESEIEERDDASVINE